MIFGSEIKETNHNLSANSSTITISSEANLLYCKQNTLFQSFPLWAPCPKLLCPGLQPYSWVTQFLCCNISPIQRYRHLPVLIGTHVHWALLWAPGVCSHFPSLESFGRSCGLGHKHQNPLQLEMLLDIRVVVGECAKVVMPNPLIPTLRKTMRQLVTGWPVKKSLSNVTLLLISWLAYNVLWVNNDRICLPPLLGCRPLFPYLNTKAFMLWNIKRLWLERAFITSKPASK